MSILSIFRSLPHFKGKYKLAGLLAKKVLFQNKVLTFLGRDNLQYTIPNSIEQVGRELLINGIYEKKTIELIKNRLNASSVFFDVGANIGSITLPIAKYTAASVHSFEPSKLSFKYLQKNVSDNKLENVYLNNVAVHSEDGKGFTFYEAEEKYGNSSLSATYGQQPHYKVNSISLDAYCNRKNITKIDVLKVDVQGYELDVLQGAKELLKNKAISYIIFELEAWAEKQAGHEVGASQKILLNNGYSLFDMKENKINEIVTEGTAMFIAVADISLINYKK